MTVQIAHVGLRNLRSYRTAELPLGPGTTLLSGDIGSGKTSLLYAMEMALFGFAEVDAGYLIRHGARDAEVSLVLTDGTHRWELRRRFVRKVRKGRETFEPTENSLATDGQRSAYSATELRRRTIELLGFPDNPNPRAHSDVWRWAIYLAQERMRDVLSPDADARMETVRKALGVEQYRLAAENARSLARELQERGASISEQATRHHGVEEEAVHWRQEEGLAERRISELDQRENKLRGELTRVRAELEEVERRQRELEGAREAVIQLERLGEELDRAIEQERLALHNAEGRLNDFRIEHAAESAKADALPNGAGSMEDLRGHRADVIRRLGELEVRKGEASGVAEQVAQVTERLRELAARSATTRLELNRAKTDRARLAGVEPVNQPRAPDERPLNELTEERSRLEILRRDLDRRHATSTAELRELAELVHEGVCPRCHRPVAAVEFEAHRTEEEERVARLHTELESATKAGEEADHRVRARLEYEGLRDQWQLLEGRRADLRGREEELTARVMDEKAQRHQLDGERLALLERQASLARELTGHNRVLAELAEVDQAIRLEEDRARVAAARIERMATLRLRIPEVETEISLHRQNEAARIAHRSEVLHQIEVGRSRLIAPGPLETTGTLARVRADELDEALQRAIRDASGPKGKLAEAKARLDELTRRRQERDSLERQAGELRRLSDWIDGEFRNAMTEMERRRLQQGRLHFERRFAEYFAALVEDTTLSARVDENFAPWVDIAGQATPAEALSGGERTALALAYRLALGRTVRDAGRLTLETLILDEPTEGFSQEQTLRMGDLLERLGLPQVILVSHERQLEGIADRVVRIRKSGGSSVIEETERPGTGATDTPAVRAQPMALVRAPAKRRKTRKLTDPDRVEGGAL